MASERCTDFKETVDAAVNARRALRRWAHRASKNVADAEEEAPADAANEKDEIESTEPVLVCSLEETEAELETEEVKELLAAVVRSPEQRTEEDIASLLGSIAGVKFFEKLTPMQQKQLCRVMTHVRFDAKATVFTQGSYGTTFYIIYIGACKVYATEGELGAKAVHESCVCVLEDGDSFGELALSSNGMRNATVVTATPSILLKVEKEDYQRVLQKMHETDLQARLEFLNKIFIFADWLEQDLRKLAYVISSRKFDKNKTIVRQGTQSDHMFFILEGSCRVLQRVSLTKFQHDVLQGNRATPSRGSDAKVDTIVEICSLNKYQYFGELALINKTDHTASVVSSTAVQVLALTKFDFYHHVDARTQELMQAYAKKYYLDDGGIRQSIHDQHKWEEYKKSLLEGGAAARRAGGRETLVGSKAPPKT
uniref:Cyclic nucleotide-binding domain-containing protein n=1 Tax=Chrysotila carterae TaxID=13221 RepID=A0A7S4AYH9_CHRCT